MIGQEIKNTETIEKLDAMSETQAVLIFKHSTRCFISSKALQKLQGEWDKANSSSLVPFFVDVVARRNVSNALANHYGVRHESPQALLIHKGKCIYHASHWDIELDEALKAAAG